MRRRADREKLGPGKHEILVKVPGCAARVALTIVVGRSPGPRAFLLGGLAGGDPVGIVVGRAVIEALDPARLRGSILVVGRVAHEGESLERAFLDGAPAAARWILDDLAEGASFGIEVRASAPGWITFPHTRADLSHKQIRRWIRDARSPVVVDAPGLRGSLRRAATERGVPTVQLEIPATSTDGAASEVLELLAARAMLPGKGAERRGRQVVIGEVTRVKGKRALWSFASAPPGAIVAKGEALARAYDELGRPRAVVSSPSRGFVLAVPSDTKQPRTVARLGRIRRIVKSRPPVAAAPDAEPGRRIGWSEWVALPDLGIDRLHAKIDTGARTSALHVTAMRQVGEERGHPILELQLPAGRWARGRRPGRSEGRTARVVVERFLIVRDSGGHAERRPVIETTLTLGDRVARISVTLTDRGDMLFPMLVGRTALAGDVIVDPGRRDLLGPPR